MSSSLSCAWRIAVRSIGTCKARGWFFAAEDYHQQYLYKVPCGYCGLGETGVTCPVGAGVDSKPAEGRGRALRPLGGRSITDPCGER
jgi:hypothetical protein